MKASIRELLNTPEPPELGPGPREGVAAEQTLEKRLEEALGRMELGSEEQKLIRALVLLWHDHLESAHILAQAVETADGAFVHGIIHRREPDFGNAKYWFRRVGNHAAFGQIAARAKSVLQAAGERQLEQGLIGRGEWDPFAFVDACERAAGAHVRMLREIQSAEFEALLDHLID